MQSRGELGTVLTPHPLLPPLEPILATGYQVHLFHSIKMADKPTIADGELSAAAKGLKKTETVVKNVLPDKA